MKAIANQIRLQFNESGIPEITLTFPANKAELLQAVAELKQVIANGKTLDCEIKQHRKSRSLDSNSYLWILCQKISEVIHNTKEFVYKKAVRDVGQFEIVPIKDEAVERWIELWGSKGLGWFAEVMDDSKLSGYKRVISYYGSSVYDQREMSVLVDEIVLEAKELGIETLTPAELAGLKEEWGKGR